MSSDDLKIMCCLNLQISQIGSCLYFNVDCDLVRCHQPDCNNPITPPGQCCPVCPPNTPTLPTVEPPSKCSQHSG